MTTPENNRELVLTMTLNADRQKIWRCWTEADLLKKWFAPSPWTTTEVELDVRPGGTNRFVMRSPDGQDMPNQGVYLDVVPNRTLVFTDAFTSAWHPSERAFMTVVVNLEDDGPNKTKYIVRVRHWSVEACEQHVKMGFHDGWGQCARQLEAVAQAL